ncbi:MAG: sulfatase [Bacteroidota bacterium]|nr:sulfatase [Bacteroidota bacterium]
MLLKVPIQQTVLGTEEEGFKMKRIFVFLLIFKTAFLFSQSNDKPNFVIIFCDDLGYGDIGVFGSPIIRTPNIDMMANQGQKWTQFYVADPVCTPSRAALMTGRYPIRSGMTSSKRAVLFPDSANGLKQEEVTIAEVLKDQGYSTGAVGKWHLGHLPKFLPLQQGFDSYYGIPYSNDMVNNGFTGHVYRKNILDPYFQAPAIRFNVALVENTIEIERPVDQTTITKRYTEKAVEFIEKNKNQPFFLYLAHSMPHIPLFASKEFLGKSEASLYVDVIEEIDWSVGQVIDALKRNNLDENTVVVFSSDNGPWLSFEIHGGSAGPLRAGKGTTFEGGQRVPTVFWGPGIVKPGVINQIGSTLDLINTFASLSGGKVPEDRKMDGYDLSKVLTEKAVSPRKDFYYWGFAQLHGYRTEQFKLHIKQREPVHYGRPTIILDSPELYNLRSDFSEKYDVSSNHPGVVKEMIDKIEKHLKDVEGSTPDQLVDRLPKE